MTEEQDFRSRLGYWSGRRVWQWVIVEINK